MHGTTSARGVSLTLSTLDRPQITIGCEPCRCRLSVPLSVDGVADAQRFLREHADCLAQPL